MSDPPSSSSTATRKWSVSSHTPKRFQGFSLAHKFFTLAEANRTLPLVKRIVQDLMAVYPQWKDLVAQYEVIGAKARPEWGEAREELAFKVTIDGVALQIKG